MKKLLSLLMLGAATFSAKAALFVNNSSSCPVVLVFYAHDATNPGPCAYYSTRLEVPAMSSVAYNNVSNINSPGLGWYNVATGASSLLPVGQGWDAVQIWSTDPGGPQTIGNPGTCATGTTYPVTGASCNFTASWTNLGGGNILLSL